MGLFDGLKEGLALAKEAKSVQATQIHLAYVQEKLADVEKKLAAIEEENHILLKENRELVLALKASKKETSFFDAGICLFKTREDGSIDHTPLCQKCKLPINQNPLNRRVWICSGCKAAFTHEAIGGAKNRIPKMDAPA